MDLDTFIRLRIKQLRERGEHARADKLEALLEDLKDVKGGEIVE